MTVRESEFFTAEALLHVVRVVGLGGMVEIPWDDLPELIGHLTVLLTDQAPPAVLDRLRQTPSAGPPSYTGGRHRRRSKPGDLGPDEGQW